MNRINQIIELTNGNEYMILDQTVYNNNNYYLCSKVAPNEEDLEENYSIIHEFTEEGNLIAEQVVNESLLEQLCSMFNILK